MIAAVASTIALAVSLASGGGHTSDAPRSIDPLAPSSKPTSVRRLSHHELAGQRIVTGFEGTSPPPELKRAIKRGRIAGVVLFADNATTQSSARALTQRLQSIPQPKNLRRPLLVMVDQEGGLVKRIDGAPHASAKEMGERGNAYTQKQGRKTGRLLRGSGINIDLAPVLDVGRPGGAIDSEDRSFGHSPDRVTQLASAFARGLRGHGVTPTAKHFPGLGAAAVNTDNQAQTIGLSRSKLRRIDERPYRRFEKGGRGLVMLSLATYRAFDDNPAALSHRVATSELRRHLGFHGVSVSDSLESVAAQSVGGIHKVVRKAAGAGTDLLLYPSLSSALEAGDTLAGLVRKGKLSHRRFNHSVERVLDLRSSFGR